MRSTQSDMHRSRLSNRMTLIEIRNRVYKRYNPGQMVKMCIRSEQGIIIKQIKATIVKMYPYHVSCVVNGFRESFSYDDMFKFITVKE